MTKKQKNHWKRAFWWIVIVDLILFGVVVGLIVALLSPPLESTTQKWSSPKLTEAPIFTVKGNKSQLTSLMNQELQKELKGNLEATISLNDQVSISGNIKILGVLIPFKMLFQPKVENSGETINLNESSVTVGRFSLPVSDVLAFIQKGASFPKWVNVEPDHKRLVIHLSGFVIRDQFTIRAEKIDLPHNDLTFNIYESPSNR